MSQDPQDRLYNLLPAIYRQRDDPAGQPLRALLAVIENEFDGLEGDIAATYDNWFIETCDAWVIPYLADLVGIDDLDVLQQPLFGQRRMVANHIAYQRRKGLATILAHIGRDVSGWPAYVADLSKRVAHTQSMKDIQPDHGKTIDLRQGVQLALLGTAFDSATRTLDVRRVNADAQSRSLPGLAGLNALALYLWRLQSYPVRRSQAGVQPRIRRGHKTHHFTFDPLGRDLALFIQPEAIEQLSEPLRPVHFPQPLTRELLAADLAEVSTASNPSKISPDYEPGTSRYYGPQHEIAIWIDGVLVPAHEVLSGPLNARNTDDWGKLIEDLGKQGEEKKAVVDPETGRFMLTELVDRDAVTVSYTYGFSQDIGSGPYRQALPDAGDEAAREDALRIDIAKSSADVFFSNRQIATSSLESALEYWGDYCKESQESGKKPQAVIRFMDSATYHLRGPLRISLPGESYLSIEAAPGERPTIIAEKGWVTAPGPSKGELVIFDRRLRLQGLLVSGPVVLPNLSGGKLDFQIRSCTLLDDLELGVDETVLIDFKISDSMVESICVGITRISPELEHDFVPAAGRKGTLIIEDSVARMGLTTTIQAKYPYALDTTVNRSTIFGPASLASVSQIEDSLLVGGLVVDKVNGQQALLRYSYASQFTPSDVPYEYCAVGSQYQPRFTSIHPTHPGYAQLRDDSPTQVRYGASNGAEMGVYNSLQVNRREANLKRMLPDYLPIGQNLGIFTVT